MMNGEAAIGINGTFNLCDVRDLANAVILAVENGKSGESYILANEVITYPEFANIVQKKVAANVRSSSFLFHWLLSLQIYWKSRRRRRAPHLHLQNT